MQWWRAGALVLLLATRTVFADDEPKPEDLKRMYQDTLVQLKAAQDRKNELATENEKLAAKAADLQRQLQAATDQLEQMKRQAADFDDRTFDLRARQAAWEAFVISDPDLRARWTVYLENSFVGTVLNLPDGESP